jgi:hypothetical protein
LEGEGKVGRGEERIEKGGSSFGVAFFVEPLKKLKNEARKLLIVLVLVFVS